MAHDVKYIDLDTFDFPDAIVALNADEIHTQQRLYVPDKGECEMEYVSEFMSWHCKACGQMDMALRNPKPRYCKWCGRKVAEQ